MTNQATHTKSPSLTPYLAVKDASLAMEFYRRAFEAVEIYRLNDPDGRVSHAEMRFGSWPIFISDEYPEISVFGPQTLGGSPVMLVLEVADVDKIFAQAVEAGAIVDRPLQDSFEGGLRNGKLIDPFGHRWMILTRLA